ncbi:calmodulin-binding protein 60 B-like isoform X4 [Malus sylvestris]|uniref:calmodulin-binding protein 60 B-like isoform X4 n=1 Tax=Malus sylvestris TaxID=3752 RepID=UPI0021AC6EA5|nr:calmodulin-binding protein 60 B-like isoform X4 [Malus sylvestris]
MALKRHFRDDGGSEDFEFPVPESKGRPAFREDVMRDATLNGRELERFFRGLVRAEMERSIPFLMSSPSVSRPPLESGSTSGGCGLQLRFINKMPSTIFTGSKVEAENGTPLQIELVDASTGAIVRSGPLSSLKIELLVVNGEFGSDDQEDWTEQEFNNYIVHARDGRRPLVTGETHVTLREGVGFVGDVVFTDNSSWIRSRKFRLAARVVAKSPSEVRIREARSEPFVVKDHRGELYEKHYPPHLNDEIWRLEKIAKDGAFHKSLCENGISTVQDFLQLYMRDASSLRNAFCVISNKIWETIIEHAMACKLDDHKCYAYHRAEHNVSLMFNSVHRLLGAIINGQFCSLDELDARQKMLVETLKQHAYRNVRDLVPVNVSTIFGLSMPLPCPQAEQFKNQLALRGRDATLNERESERFFRRIAREEVEHGILPFLMSSPSVSRPSLESGSTSGGCGLQLRFINKLPSTIFTGSKVGAENGAPLQIELVDASTGAIVRSGPLSSLKIELLVVNGEFGSDDREDWTQREFNNYIVRARDGRRPLVTGEIHVTLREGVGFVGDVVFTDNSGWIRSRTFRLAARVVAKSSSEVRIREARSEPFVVKDHCGELYKKHYPPHLNDEIWRLERIAKDGAFHKRLCENGISTVEDFLQLYMRDASSLRNAFGLISNKVWETIIEHAMACKLDDHKFYAFHGAEGDVSLIFNSIHRLVAAIINGQFCSLDELDVQQMMLVETLKQHAYQDVRDLVPVDASTILGLSRPLPCPQAEQFTSPNPDLQQIQFQFTHQDELPIQLGFNHGSASTSSAYQAAGSSNQLMVSLAQSQPMQLRSNSFSVGDSNSVIYSGESSSPPFGDFQAPILPTGHLGTENLFQVEASTLSPANPIWGQAGGFYFTSGSEAEAAHFPLPAFVHNAGARRKAKACWCKLRAAVKWMSVRRHMTARPSSTYLNFL